MRCFLLFLGLLLISNQAFSDEATTPVVEPITLGWIWKSSAPESQERIAFRREFLLPPGVVSASITVSCDNRYRLFLNGHDLGMSDDWQAPRSYEVSKNLESGGRNVIAVEGRNDGGAAGMALSFCATLKDGEKLYVVSDANWTCNSETSDGWEKLDYVDTEWPKAVVIGKMGEGPWGNLKFINREDTSSVVDKTADYQVASGFKLERIYQVPAEQGSWVAMTMDDKGRMICADQYGKIYQVTLSDQSGSETKVEAMTIPLSGAHGLLWHDGVLWVTVNEGTDQSGVWRVTDTNGDGIPDLPELIKAFNGRGEHGPHALVASQDGKMIYVVAGNETKMPAFEKSLATKSWGEDQLLPRQTDPTGYARNVLAPGGWIARFTKDGSNWETVSMGLRNPYDIAFNETGDLFTYDSDMEWDLGMPWYRPARICHVVAGAEFGWRNGSGVWPSYYEDSMASLLDIGPGSPAGLVSGKGTKFPQKYQRALFALDWTFGTIYAVHLTPDGPGYQAQREEFIAGNGFPLTDATVGSDGALYFLTGGRRVDSSLWRVIYTGTESTTSIEYHYKEINLIPTADALALIGDEHRLNRYNARVSLEQSGPENFNNVLSDEKSSAWQVIGASIGITRIGTAEDSKKSLAALDRIDWSQLNHAQNLNWLRAVGLVFARHGAPEKEVHDRVLSKIDASFPAQDEDLNRELCRMLAYLQAPNIVNRTLTLMDTASPAVSPDWLNLAKRNGSYGKTVEEMLANLPPAQIIHYLYCLRVVNGPWKQDERQRFLAWFDQLLTKKGGASYAGFLTDLKKQALETCTPEELQWITNLQAHTPASLLANLPEIKGPGREWTVDEIVKLADEGIQGRDRENGKKMFQASLCAACHRHGSEGGATGPDLTTLGGRFTVRDVAEAIQNPNKAISSQYAFDLIIGKDGSEITGKIIEEKDEKWMVASNPFDLSQRVEIASHNIKETKPSPISPMPAGLINRLNPDELKDLLAYLLGN